MQSARQVTVLFADVTGSTRLYETAGDSQAADAIARCLDILRRAAEASGGRVVKMMGDEVMVLFASPNEAADAATRMHTYVESLPPIAGQKIAVRIGFHSGPVIQRDNDIFGDTVNIASRLTEQAVKGQVLTSDQTMPLLAPLLQNSIRRLYDVTVKGKAEEVGLCEFLWRKSPDITDIPAGAPPHAARVKLRLKIGERNLIRQRAKELIRIGRDPSCEIVVHHPRVSREHCIIERRLDKFVVRDHSTNGTYISVEGETEMLLRREEYTLRKQGCMTFGQPRAESDEVMEYFCE